MTKCPHCGFDDSFIIYISPEIDMQEKPYRNPIIKEPRRESPNDFMLVFLRFLNENPERKNITPKAFAIIRNEREKKAKK